MESFEILHELHGTVNKVVHFACAFNQLESVIQLLIKEYPMAAKQKDSNGDCLLHYVCDNNQLESVL
jgi:hypothetical protein